MGSRGRDPRYHCRGIDLKKHPECKDIALVWETACRLAVRTRRVPGVDFEDLVQSGYLALRYCAEHHDATRADMYGYGIKAIRRCMNELIAHASCPVHVPTGTRHREYMTRDQPDEDFSNTRRRTRRRYQQSLRMARGALEDLELFRATGLDTRWVDVEAVRHHVAKLEELSQWVLTRYYGLDGADPMNFKEIGQVWPGRAVTRQRVEQVHSQALKALKGMLG
jgi:DNA-directed RNA polymerase specialized sigma subunit